MRIQTVFLDLSLSFYIWNLFIYERYLNLVWLQLVIVAGTTAAEAATIVAISCLLPLLQLILTPRAFIIMRLPLELCCYGCLCENLLLHLLQSKVWKNKKKFLHQNFITCIWILAGCLVRKLCNFFSVVPLALNHALAQVFP